MRNPISAYRRFCTRGLSDWERIEANIECATWNLVIAAVALSVTLGLHIVAFVNWMP